MVYIKGSLTIEKYIEKKTYTWKSKNKISEYKKKCRRAFLRFSGADFIFLLKDLERSKRQIDVEFIEDNGGWILKLSRNNNVACTLQAYVGNHPHAQIVVNKVLPIQFWSDFENIGQRTLTLPVLINLDLDQWKDINLELHHLFPLVEKDSKALLNVALNYNFSVNYVSRGREYDLELIAPNGTTFIIALSSHEASTPQRSREQRRRKILLDIAKMLPVVHKRNVCPVIISKPLTSQKSWSYTTDNYLLFYQKEYGFYYLTTTYKKGWEKCICEQLLQIDKDDSSKSRTKNSSTLEGIKCFPEIYSTEVS